MNHPLKIEFDPKRIFGLDVLRASAILLVMILHSKNYLPFFLKKSIENFLVDGVSIFFVLSGFLIGGILIQSLNKNPIDKKTLLQFWIRRWFRTLPNYFLILLTLCILTLAFSNNFSLWTESRYFVFSQNLFWENPLFFPESWSLSVEEWFYLFIPLIILLLAAGFNIKARKSLLITALVILLAVTLFRFLRYSEMGIASFRHLDAFFRKQVFTRLDSLMYGMIGAYLNYYHQQHWIKYKKLLFAVGIILLVANQWILFYFVPLQNVYRAVFSFSVDSFAVLMLLPFLGAVKKGNGFVSKSITFTSIISYSMYLVNYSLIQNWIVEKIPWGRLYGNKPHLTAASELVFFWVLTFVLSTLLYKYYEAPTTKLRDNSKVKKLLKISSEIK